MRDILFRGKSLETKEWLEGFYLKSFEFDNDGLAVIITETPRKARYVYKETVGQYTGLTDKNGKKIFEDDIVNEYDMPEEISNVGVVQWSETFVGWHINKTRCMYCHEFMSYEVIGNIHDNLFRQMQR